MTTDVTTAYVVGLVQVAKWISIVIMSGVGFCATVIALRLLNQTELKFGQIVLKLRQFPALLVAMSVAHLFLTWMFAQRVAMVTRQGDKAGIYAWLKLETSDAFIFNNMKPRLWEPTAGPFGYGAFVAASADTAFWATFSFSVAVIASVVCSLTPSYVSRFTRARHYFQVSALGCAIAGVNWLIGSYWAITASSLLRDVTAKS